MNLGLLLAVLLPAAFGPAADRALTSFRNGDLPAASAALDDAYRESPAMFAANNLHYLRGRIAETESDWERAKSEFMKIGMKNPLHPLAAWRAARASVRLSDYAAAEGLLAVLPRNFPNDLILQLARETGGSSLALKIYQGLSTREARLERAKIVGDTAAFWSLLRDRKNDDVALEAARLVAALARSAQEQMDLAETFMAHRQFDDAFPLYRGASRNSTLAAEARYQMARILFLRGSYVEAIQAYEQITKDFAGSQWEMDADYQIANTYWRMGDYRSTEQVYLRYIARYGRQGQEEGAVRNLVDVYRVLGENEEALKWTDRMLARQITDATRQVLLFSKAKTLYSQDRCGSALPIFRQLGGMRLRETGGGTTRDEVRYFEALCLYNIGNRSGAESIWRDLAGDPLSYYGQRSAQRLGRNTSVNPVSVCQPLRDPTSTNTAASMDSIRRPLRTEMQPGADPVLELVFLHLWDDASLWLEATASRPDAQRAAELAYLGGRFHRSIAHANRMPQSNSPNGFLYPAGYRLLVCDAAAEHGVDPLWLHAIIWQESKYNPNARSGASARGLMQFIPETANAVRTALGIADLSLDGLYDPATNIRMGAYYYGSRIEQLRHPEMALAAYNGGVENVNRWRAKSPEGDLELFIADIGFVETKKYVMEVFRARAAYELLGSQ